MKWDDVRGGFNSMMNTKSLDDVILIYTNSNLESKKRIKTNLADFSTSRYPNNSYNRVYYGTQSSNTLYIYGSYELKQ